MSLEEILAKIDTGAAEREAKKIAAKDPFDVLIVGGGPAGAAAAVYAARKGIRTGVARRALRRPGARHAGHRELHLGQGNRRARSSPLALEEHVRHYDVDIMNLQRAKALVPAPT